MSNRSVQWRFKNTGFQSGIFNMRYDEDLAARLQRNEITPTIRIYGWKPWAISLGYNQKESEINFRKCEEDGIDVVRRATGGRAILHAHEVTYSVVMYAEERSISEIYSDISNALVAGLQAIHPEIEMEMSQPHFPTLYRKAESFPCFSSSARYEIQINGRKLVGSAQRRFTSQEFPEVVLQHGSILLGPQHKRLATYFNNTDSESLRKIESDFDQKTIDLETVAGRSVSFEEVGEAILKGFEKEWGITMESYNEAVL